MTQPGHGFGPCRRLVLSETGARDHRLPPGLRPAQSDTAAHPVRVAVAAGLGAAHRVDMDSQRAVASRVRIRAAGDSDPVWTRQGI